ncbi:MAG: alpha/beta hydrolase [Phycisphaerales bacterium]|nr:alpha/beta hydrolase [Phycisphaerales bacterium]
MSFTKGCYDVVMIHAAGVLLTLYILVCLLIAGCQSRLVYHPLREMETTPREAGLAYEDVRLTTSDGVRLAAWYVPCGAARGSVIFCHGNAGNISHRLREIVAWRQLGFHVLVFDYRGFGQSEGLPTEAGTYLDAQAAWQFMTEVKGESPSRIVLAGRSLGGAVAIELASRHLPGALVVESTFTSLPDVGQRVYWYLPVRLLMSYRYDSIRKVGAIRCPKLFLHGTEDQLIPISMARRLFDAACPPSRFIETPGDHGSAGMMADPMYVAQVGQWLDQALASTASPAKP